MLDFCKKVKPLQGYKVTNADRSRRIGIAANSLEQLRTKAEIKFGIENSKIYLASDGTEVDQEYFETLKEQTVFICAAKNQKFQTDYDLLLSSISSTEIIDTGKLISNFVKEDREHLTTIFLQVRRDYDEKTTKSTRDEHVEWFESLEMNAFTKEDVMRRRSQDRIRGYFYKVKDELLRSEVYKSSGKGKHLILEILDLWKYLLSGVDYFSCMFDRSFFEKHSLIAPKDETDAARFVSKKMRTEIKEFVKRDKCSDVKDLCLSLCNDKGEFRCFGEWSKTVCNYQSHAINPYASRENLILFQTWNLDHQAELSRTVLPSLIKNLEDLINGKAKCRIHNTKGVHISILTYFKEFFTLANLKLVHIVCHDKGGHDLSSNGGIICSKCPEYKFILRLENLVKGSKLNDQK